MKRDFHGQRAVVIGAGKSGQALVRYLLERGAVVALSDQRSREQLAGLEALNGLPVRFDLGGHSPELFEQADFIAVSPGVPLDCPPLRRARSCRVPLLGEIEIAAREIDAPLIAVTGTNGKSTTTSLIGAIFRAWGKRTFVGGNLGNPLVNACAEENEAVVVELSSFQLESIVDFHPAIALLLNFSPDHLDRYPDPDSYYRAKMRLFENMGAADFAVLNADDGEVCRRTEGIAAQKVWFSARGRLVEGLIRLGDKLVWNRNGAEQRFALEHMQLAGEHNIENAMAAMTAALLQGCPGETAWDAVCAFTGLPHRMQLVRVLNDVAWYNDSKGTNVGSVVKSLHGLKGGITLIAGGRDKGGEYLPLRLLLEQKVGRLILLGEAAPRMAAELAGSCAISRVDSLAEAVREAHACTAPGGTVLLSPACSSFDMFGSFEERGEAFERLVRQLPQDKAVL